MPFPHSVAAKSVCYTLFVAITERVFFMKKLFSFPVLSAKNICSIAMLMAVTAILAIFCTFRIGDFIKIPLKFISVFISAALYGPWFGGLCGAVGDILNLLLVPSGAPLPALTFLEFLVGFVYGVFFFNHTNKTNTHLLRCVICAVAVFLIDIFLSTAVLLKAGYFPSFISALYLRLPAGIIKALIQFLFFLFSSRFVESLRRFGGIKNE